MVRWIAFIAFLLLSGCRKESKLREALAVKTGEVTLPGGAFDLSAPLVIENADKLTVRGDGTKLIMKFDGEAALIIRKSKDVRIENISIEGNRPRNQARINLPPADQPMARWNKGNGILVDDSDNVTLSKLTVREVTGYGILASRSRKILIEEALVGDSGSLNEKGANNATGGILFEEGCEQFIVRKCKLRNIRGNGIWTHSLYKSPRNQHGEFVENDLRYIGRDALQAGHAVDLKIVGNTGGFIGFPPETVDLSTLAVPCALDTAGNVEKSVYAHNRFEEVNGKCADLDGFHDGVVQENECVNRRDEKAYPHGHYAIVLNNSNPDMQSKGIEIVSNKMEGFRFGAVFLIGEGHVVKNNVFRRINLARCNDNLAAGCLYKADEPDLLRTGIYLGKGAERPAPARGIVVENNVVQGYGMNKFCIGSASGVKVTASTVRNNKCEE